jgi:curved DNA-binding protein CbpA
MHLISGEVDLYRILQVDRAAHPRVLQAAYRALATIYHPDQTRTGSHDEMALINRAYAILRDPAQRQAHDRRHALLEPAAAASEPVAAPTPEPVGISVPPTAPGAGSALSYGRYAGWTLDQLVRTDPDYLRWLSRHTSGLRYRAEIERLLAGTPTRQPAASLRRAACRR